MFQKALDLYFPTAVFPPGSLRETSSKVANPVPVRLGAARRAVGLDQISKDFELECSEINQNLFKGREISPKLRIHISNFFILFPKIQIHRIPQSGLACG